MSESTSELFAAFAKFQGDVENASKGKQGHGYKYADLAECINTAKPELLKNGLAVAQMLGSDENRKQTLTTILTHSSGQWMSSEFTMVEAVLAGGSGKNPAQTLGSAITYQRRYAYAAILGLAQEDEDAAGLVAKKAKTQQHPITQQQQIEIQTLFESKGYTLETMLGHWGLKTLGDMMSNDYQNNLNAINSWGNANG